MAKANILIVEDESVVSKYLQGSLESMGYQVLYAAFSGVEAVRKTEELRPDIILMDIDLKSNMDGIDAAGKIHDSLDIPVIYLTAYADEDTLKRAKITEPGGYIIKPFKTGELNAVIEMALYNHQVKKKLKESERDYRELVNNMNSIIVRVDSGGKIKFLNKFAQRYFGYSDYEIPCEDSSVTVIPERGRTGEDFGAMIENMVKSPEKYSVKESENIGQNGEQVCVLWTSRAVYGEDGRIKEIISVGNDVTVRRQIEEELVRYRSKLEFMVKNLTLKLDSVVQEMGKEIIERKNTEERIGRLYSLQAAARNINRVLLGIKDMPELFDSICNLLRGVRHIKYVWIGLAAEGTNGIKPVAQSGFDREYLSILNKAWDNSGYTIEPAATAIKTRQLCVIGDIENNPEYPSMWKDAERRGYASCIALPLGYKEDIIGVISVYSEKRDAFGDEETEFLLAVADYITAGIKSIIYEKALKESEKKYRCLFESLNDAAFLADAESGVIIDVNEQAEVLLGCLREEIIGMKQAELFPQYKKNEHKTKFKVYSGKESEGDYTGEVTRKDGIVIQVAISSISLSLAGKSFLLVLVREKDEE